jgi:hypothetical protein
VERPIVWDCARCRAIPFDNRFELQDGGDQRHLALTMTRRGSNPARSSGIQVTHQQRAEIFARPFRVSAPLIVIGDPTLTELVLRFFVDDGNGMDGQRL